MLAPSQPSRSRFESLGQVGARGEGRERGRKQRDVLFWAYLAAIAWVPFWFGSNDLFAWSINAVLFSALVAALELNLLVHGTPHPVSPARLRVAVACFLAVVAWICVQAATLTPQTWHNPIWAMTSSLVDAPVPGSISVNRDATWISLMRLMTGACSFWLALQLCRNTKRATALMMGIAWIVCAYSVYGLVAFYVLPNTILWFPKEFYLGSLTSTFINRNTFATYAGLGLVCFLGRILDFSAARSRLDDLRTAFARALSHLVGSGGLNVIGAMIVLAALLQSASRGGVIAAALGGFLFLLLYMTHLHGRSRGIAVLVTAGAMLTLGAVAVLYGDVLAARLTSDELRSQERLAAYAIIARAIADAPLQGFGYGTFAEVFPLYRDGTLSPWFVWDMAHNTFLELALELGVPATSLFVLALATLIGRCLLAARQPYPPAGALVAICSTVVIIVASTVDFSVQIQAVALTWAAILGAGYAQCEEASAVRRSPVGPTASATPFARSRSSSGNDRSAWTRS